MVLFALSELFEALAFAGLVFELAADATRVSAVSPLLRVLATWRSARLEAFDVAGLDSSLAGVPAASFATLLVVGAVRATGAGATTGGTAGGALDGVAV
jgi:hypothetical protein